jgi:5-methylcytosine-specific restriction enzyme A
LPTFILIWSPGAYPWDDHEQAVETTARREVWPQNWAVGSRRQGITPGDRAFLWRASPGRGLVASGTITSGIRLEPHWDGSERTAPFADVDWDTVLRVEDRLPFEALPDAVPNVPWHALQGGGIKVRESAATDLVRLWEQHLGARAFRSPDEPRAVEGRRFPEGAVTRIEVNRYERDPRARQACLDHWGYLCAVCQFSFADRYGSLGREYIHVHHTVELAHAPADYEVDPVADLRPVCPNCHAMLHRDPGPALTVQKLQELLR